MRLLIALSCLLLLAVACARPRPHPQPAPPPQPKPAVQRPTEIRAVWVSDTPRLDWDEATRQLQRAGYNTMYVNLASAGALFGSDAVARGIAPIGTAKTTNSASARAWRRSVVASSAAPSL